MTKKIFLSFLCIILLSNILFSCNIDNQNESDANNSFSEENAKIIISERQSLGGTVAAIYLQKDSGDKIYLGSVSSEPENFPFQDGNYKIEWGENKVTIIYYSGTQDESLDDPDTWRHETFDFSQF